MPDWALHVRVASLMWLQDCACGSFLSRLTANHSATAPTCMNTMPVVRPTPSKMESAYADPS